MTGILVVGAGALIFYKIYRDGQKPKENPREILEILKGPAPQGDASTVDALVKLAATGGDNAKDALAALTKLQGRAVAPAIAAELAAARGPLRDVMMEAAAAHPTKESIATLTQIALNEPGPERLKALSALGKGGAGTDVPELMKHAAKFKDDDSRRPFYRAIEQMLAKEKDPGSRVRALAPALKDADAASRPAIFRLLGYMGGAAANEVLAAEIAAGSDRRRAAVEALRVWNNPDTTVADALLTAAGSGDHDLLTGAYARTAARIASRTAEEIVAGLRKAVPIADTNRSREEFAAALGTLGTAEALAFATELAGGSDPLMAKAVEPAVASITANKEVATTLKPGENLLDGRDAVIPGSGKDAAYSSTVRYITGWRSPETRMAWDIIVPAGMTFDAEVEQSSLRDEHTFFLTIGLESRENKVTMTKSTDDFVRVHAGKFRIVRPGAWRVWLEPGRMTDNETLMNVRKIILRPVE
jgi:hypothetical protein